MGGGASRARGAPPKKSILARLVYSVYRFVVKSPGHNAAPFYFTHVCQYVPCAESVPVCVIDCVCTLVPA